MIRRETQVQLTEDVTGNAVSIVGQGWVNGRPTCKDQKVCKDTRTTILSQKATQWYKLYSHVTNRYVDIRTIKQRCTLRSIQSLRKLVQVFEIHFLTIRNVWAHTFIFDKEWVSLLTFHLKRGLVSDAGGERQAKSLIVYGVRPLVDRAQA